VFLGTPGPAANLPRAREHFARARAVWEASSEAGDVARSCHNEANALQSLGATAAELEEAIELYERALLFRTAARAIARGVTLHNMGAALRKLAERAPGRDEELLKKSEEALLAALAIREEEGLAEGLAASWFQLGLTLDTAARAGRPGARSAAHAAFEAAASAYEAVGKGAEADVARRCALETGGSSSPRPAL